VRRGDDVPAAALAEREVVRRGVGKSGAVDRPRGRADARDEHADVGREDDLRSEDEEVVARRVRKVAADVGPARATVLRLEDVADAGRGDPAAREAAEHRVDVARVRGVDGDR